MRQCTHAACAYGAYICCTHRHKLHPKTFMSSLFGKDAPTDAFTGMMPSTDLAALTSQAKQVRVLSADVHAFHSASCIMCGVLRQVGVLSRGNPHTDDVLAVQELLTYGMKGLAAYAAHAAALGKVNVALSID